MRLAETGFDEQAAAEEWPQARAEAESVVSDCVEVGVEIVGWFDGGFPERLRDIPDAPAVLFYRGNIEAAHMPEAAAVVGTRGPSGWGSGATRLSRALAREGWSIVSGLAAGVDTVAHRTALEEGAPTVAILGNGLASVYPATNRSLAEEIVSANGLAPGRSAPAAEGRAARPC